MISLLPAVLKRVIGGLIAAVVSLGYWLLGKDPWRLTREEIGWCRRSFSQFGEDLHVLRIFERLGVERGRYVDAGAHDPIGFSNTHSLHLQGWTGVNIDMSATTIERFERLRPADANVCAALSNRRERVVHVPGGNPLLDSIVPEGDPAAPQDGRALETRTLDDVLGEAGLDSIDYLNIDCEGFDLRVLQGLDLDGRRPRLITIEAVEGDALRDIVSHLASHDYCLVACHAPTSFFVQIEDLPRLGRLHVDLMDALGRSPAA